MSTFVVMSGGGLHPTGSLSANPGLTKILGPPGSYGHFQSMPVHATHITGGVAMTRSGTVTTVITLRNTLTVPWITVNTQ